MIDGPGTSDGAVTDTLDAVVSASEQGRGSLPVLSDDDIAALDYLTAAERAEFVKVAREQQAVDRGARVRPLTFREFVDRVTNGRFRWYTYAVVLVGVLQRVA